MNLNQILKSQKGSSAAIAIIFAAFLIFVFFPLFAAVFEKYLLVAKTQMVKDSVDITNIATYTAINSNNLGKVDVTFDASGAEDIYRELLAKNLNLNPDLSPKPSSIAQGTVTIESLEFFTGEFPCVCPNNTILKRPSVHACINVPIKPLLYVEVLLGLMGKQYIYLKVHVDSDIPLNN